MNRHPPRARESAPDPDAESQNSLIELQATRAVNQACWRWLILSDQVQGNAAFFQLLGLPAHARQVPLRSLLDALSVKDRERLPDLARQLVSSGEVLEVEHPVFLPPGEERWLRTIVGLVRDEEGSVLAASGVCRDIALEKQRQAHFEAEHHRLVDLIERLPAFVCLIGPDYSVRFANQAFIQHFGQPSGRSCYEAISRRHDPCDFCPALEVFDSKSLNIWEMELPDQGRSFHLYAYPFADVDGSPLALVLGIDITRQKRVQQALSLSEERYRRITENLAMGIALLDADLRMVAVNPRLQEWFPDIDVAAEPSLTKALPWIAQAHEQQELGQEPPWIQALLLGEVREALYPGPAPDTCFRLLFCPVLSPDANENKPMEAASLIAIIEDVSERRKLDARLENARKLEALGTLAAGVAHEINQPLNALQLYASGLELLLEKQLEPERDTVLSRLRLITRESETIRDIITHMRALVREDSAPQGPADLGQAVERALSLINAQLRSHGVDLKVDLPIDLPPVQANPVQLEQVVINLVVNSMQALDLLSRSDKLIMLTAACKDSRVLLSVADNGPGFMSNEHLVFDPFYTTKEEGHSMGLGLSIVHSFLQSWGGEIGGANNELGGATFTLTLNRYPEG